MIPSFPVGGELLLELTVAGIIVTAFASATVVQRDTPRLLVGNVAGVIAGLLFLGEALFAPESLVLTLVACVFVVVLFAAHGVRWRDRSPDRDSATAE